MPILCVFIITFLCNVTFHRWRLVRASTSVHLLSISPRTLTAHCKGTLPITVSSLYYTIVCGSTPTQRGQKHLKMKLNYGLGKVPVGYCALFSSASTGLHSIILPCAVVFASRHRIRQFMACGGARGKVA